MKKPKVSMRSNRPRLRTQKISLAGKTAFPGGPMAFPPGGPMDGAGGPGGPPGSAPPFPGPAGGGGPMGAAPGDMGE